MNPWEVLGLERAEAGDPAAVKRGYARMLRQHRPDRDPEGFRRVRDAYELLTGPMAGFVLASDEDDEPAAAASPAAPADAVSDPPTERIVVASAPAADPPTERIVARTAPADGPKPVAVATPSPSAPGPLECAWRQLEALASDDTAADDARIAAARAVLALAPEPRAVAPRLAQTLADHPAALAAVADDRLLLAAAAQGGGGALVAVADHLASEQSARLGPLVAAAAADPALADDGELHFRLGLAAAIERPREARMLAALAFRSLPPQRRRQLDRLELRIRIGGELERWPPALRAALVDGLDRGEMPAVNPAQLRPRLAALPASSAVRHAVAQAFPSLRVAPKRPAARRILEQRQPSGGGAGAWRGIWVIAVLIMLLGRAASCAGGGSQPYRQPSSDPDRFRSPPPAYQPFPPPQSGGWKPAFPPPQPQPGWR